MAKWAKKAAGIVGFSLLTAVGYFAVVYLFVSAFSRSVE